MTNLNLMVVEDGHDICLGNDVTSVEIKKNELVFVYDNGEQEGVYLLDRADLIRIEINR